MLYDKNYTRVSTAQQSLITSAKDFLLGYKESIFTSQA